MIYFIKAMVFKKYYKIENKMKIYITKKIVKFQDF